jgi:hypothetical protein
MVGRPFKAGCEPQELSPDLTALAVRADGCERTNDTLRKREIAKRTNVFMRR